MFGPLPGKKPAERQHGQQPGDGIEALVADLALLALQALVGEIENPRQHQRQRETDQHEEGHEARRPLGQVELRCEQVRRLDHQPADDQVGGADLEHVTTLEFGEQVQVGGPSRGTNLGRV